GAGKQEVVPTESPVVAPHAVWSTVQQDEQRVLLSFVEVWRQRDHVVNAFAGFAREPEVTKWLPIDLRDLFGVERREWLLSFGREIEPNDFRGIDRAFPV